MRILFVDDEQDILDGLQRMLRRQRKEWEMVFVGSAREALAEMDQSKVDVLVSDMKMPGMDGAALLKQVQESHPSTVRIMLSGHADLEASMRAVTVSHQFLIKPCDADTLKQTVTRACSLHALMDDEVLQEAVGQLGELPVIPRVYQSLVSALSEQDVDLARIADLVEEDPSIAAKILQLVNSSYFGVQREITNLRDATNYLGINTIRDLVLSFEVFQQFDESTTGSQFSIDREQAHSVLTGRIARRLLDDKRDSEQAFLAAMLHDVGKLILATKFPAKWKEVVSLTESDGLPLLAAEERVFGVNHAAVGAYLLGLWGMPYTVIEAVAHHHHPSSVIGEPKFDVLAAVHVANGLAHELSLAGTGHRELDKKFVRSIGVVEKLPQWRDEFADEVYPTDRDAA